jgi:hypothetical protein
LSETAFSESIGWFFGCHHYEARIESRPTKNFPGCNDSWS